MSRYRTTWLWVLLLVGSALGAAGCERGFIDEAARRNLASFVVDIVETAVNETIAP